MEELSDTVNEVKTLRICKIETHLSANNHPRDSRILFDEPTHIYTIDGKQLTSVTTFLKEYQKEFNASLMIRQILKSKQYHNDPTYKYYQKSFDEISKMWSDNCKTASDAGTHMHLCIELFLNKLPYENNTKEFNMFLNYVRDHDVINTIFRTEWIIYSEEHQIAGSIDCTLRNNDGTYSVVDWKRCGDVNKKSNYSKMKEPLNHLYDSKFNHYALQLNSYRYILETCYNMRISRMYLVVCHPDNDNYIIIDMPFLYKDTKTIFDNRKKLIDEKKPFEILL